jgi:hypothetical protein
LLFVGIWVRERVNAAPTTLGKYPLCEPSAVVNITDTETGENYLFIGDNEQKNTLFLYPVTEKGLDSNNQIQLVLEKKKEISDIEAIAKLDNNKVLIFGSHSRNSKCAIKDKRRRFLQAQLSGNQLKLIGELVKYPQKDVKLESQILFKGVDISKNEILSDVSRDIEQAESKANQAMMLTTEQEQKNACQEINAFNAEGAVAVASRVWVGLRSPLVSEDSKDYAVLLRMANVDNYQFDGAALVDLRGRGIRELTFDNNWIWGIAGGPKDGEDNFVLWKVSADTLKPNQILKPTMVRDLPISSEGLAIVDETAYILIDGDTGNTDNQCEVPGKFIQFSLP